MKVRISKAPDGKGKFINKLGSFMQKAKLGAQVTNRTEIRQEILSRADFGDAPETIANDLANIYGVDYFDMVDEVADLIGSPEASNPETVAKETIPEEEVVEPETEFDYSNNGIAEDVEAEQAQFDEEDSEENKKKGGSISKNKFVKGVMKSLKKAAEGTQQETSNVANITDIPIGGRESFVNNWKQGVKDLGNEYYAKQMHDLANTVQPTNVPIETGLETAGKGREVRQADRQARRATKDFRNAFGDMAAGYFGAPGVPNYLQMLNVVDPSKMPQGQMPSGVTMPGIDFQYKKGPWWTGKREWSAKGVPVGMMPGFGNMQGNMPGYNQGSWNNSWNTGWQKTKVAGTRERVIKAINSAADPSKVNNVELNNNPVKTSNTEWMGKNVDEFPETWTPEYLAQQKADNPELYPETNKPWAPLTNQKGVVYNYNTFEGIDPETGLPLKDANGNPILNENGKKFYDVIHPTAYSDYYSASSPYSYLLDEEYTKAHNIKKFTDYTPEQQKQLNDSSNSSYLTRDKQGNDYSSFNAYSPDYKEQVIDPAEAGMQPWNDTQDFKYGELNRFSPNTVPDIPSVWSPYTEPKVQTPFKDVYNAHMEFNKLNDEINSKIDSGQEVDPKLIQMLKDKSDAFDKLRYGYGNDFYANDPIMKGLPVTNDNLSHHYYDDFLKFNKENKPKEEDGGFVDPSQMQPGVLQKFMGGGDDFISPMVQYQNNDLATKNVNDPSYRRGGLIKAFDGLQFQSAAEEAFGSNPAANREAYNKAVANGKTNDSSYNPATNYSTLIGANINNNQNYNQGNNQNYNQNYNQSYNTGYSNNYMQPITAPGVGQQIVNMFNPFKKNKNFTWASQSGPMMGLNGQPFNPATMGANNLSGYVQDWEGTKNPWYKGGKETLKITNRYVGTNGQPGTTTNKPGTGTGPGVGVYAPGQGVNANMKPGTSTTPGNNTTSRVSDVPITPTEPKAEGNGSFRDRRLDRRVERWDRRANAGMYGEDYIDTPGSSTEPIPESSYRPGFAPNTNDDPNNPAGSSNTAWQSSSTPSNQIKERVDIADRWREEQKINPTGQGPGSLEKRLYNDWQDKNKIINLNNRLNFPVPQTNNQSIPEGSPANNVGPINNFVNNSSQPSSQEYLAKDYGDIGSELGPDFEKFMATNPSNYLIDDEIEKRLGERNREIDNNQILYKDQEQRDRNQQSLKNRNIGLAYGGYVPSFDPGGQFNGVGPFDPNNNLNTNNCSEEDKKDPNSPCYVPAFARPGATIQEMMGTTTNTDQPQDFEVNYDLHKAKTIDTNAIANIGAAGSAGLQWNSNRKDSNYTDGWEFDNLTADNRDPGASYVDNAGGYSGLSGRNMEVSSNPYIVGQAGFGAKYGGTPNYKEGGTYNMTKNELMQFMAQGGQIEFI